MPKVSVILPVYNCDQFIFDTVQSVLDQTYTDFELIIVDDCSTDNTVAIIRGFQDDRIQLTLKEKNTGYTDSLNYAVSIAKGQYIARMDGDDICLPTRFEKQISFLDNNPTIILCGTGIQIIGTQTVLKHPTKHDDIKVKLCFGNSFYHPTVMGLKEVFAANPYDNKYEPAEDYDLWTRLVFKGELANLNEVLLFYRVHENQVSIERKSIQDSNSYLIKFNMFASFELENYFDPNIIHLIIGRPELKTIGECETVQFITQFLIDKNREVNNFKSREFEKKLEEAKIAQIKSFFTKDKFLKISTYFYFMNKCTFTEFSAILDLKKRTLQKIF